MKLILPAGHSLNKNNDKPTLEINGIDHLPRDLIIEILSRLPVKDLSKFRSVSKQWLHLLYNHPQFIARHRQLSRRSPLLLFRKYSSHEKEEEEEEDSSENYRVTIELTSMDMDGTSLNKLKASICGPVYTFASCGPLVVLSCTYRVYVCNPSMQEFVQLPRSSVPRYFTIGFGNLPGSNEYKVVHLFSRDPLIIGEEEMGCEIFTLRDGEGTNSGSWKRIEDCPYTVPTNCSPVCVNGILYWKVSKQVKESSTESILSLDLDREEFGVISYPKCYADSSKKQQMVLTGFKGCLSLVDCCLGTSAMEIWLLKINHGDHNNSCCWVKEYSVWFDSKIKIKGVVPSDDEEGEVVINTEQKGLGYYKVENKSFRRINNSGIVEYKKQCLYYDSFFSLHHNN